MVARSFIGVPFVVRTVQPVLEELDRDVSWFFGDQALLAQLEREQLGGMGDALSFRLSAQPNERDPRGQK